VILYKHSKERLLNKKTEVKSDGDNKSNNGNSPNDNRPNCDDSADKAEKQKGLTR